MKLFFKHFLIGLSMGLVLVSGIAVLAVFMWLLDVTFT